ncbi:MAG TPA: cytochrome c biogenesis protein CcdA [Kofleriaceae bacterium]|nr:cytochrome c biogenesis protein CcdA [Kofleriaceae bacterium]
MRRPTAWSILVVLVIVSIPALAFAAGDGDFAEYEDRGLGWMYLASFGFGFLTSLTPCVYPMIPITLAIFGARGKDVSKRRAILLATSYVVGMGVTYSVLGVTIALVSGAADFGTQLAHPAVVLPLVALFLALAASMFGAFDLNLPSGLQARLNQIGGKGFGGAFAMGLVGGLIAAPCTGPFLAGLLAYVSTTGSVVGGGSLLFVYAIGMGVLFWVLAAFALSLPKSGAWMEWVKSIGGIALLWAALYFLRPLVPDLRMFASPELWFVGASAGLVAAGIAAGGVHLSFHGPWSHRLRKGLGVVLIVLGAYAAWDWWLTPKQRLPWIYDEVVAFERAAAEGKGVMIDFSATWCIPCAELELTFGDDDVHDAITKRFVPLKFDVTEDTEANDALRARWGATTLPAVIFVDDRRRVLARVKKYLDPDQMMRVVRPAAKQLPPPAPPTMQPAPPAAPRAP